MQDIELTGSQEVLDELQSGRTRELLLLLQDKPIPEVIDPLSFQSALSGSVIQSTDNDYQLANTDDGTDFNLDDTLSITDIRGVRFSPTKDVNGVTVTVNNSLNEVDRVYLLDGSSSILDEKSVTNGETVSLIGDLSSGVDYYIGAGDGGQGSNEITYNRTLSPNYPRSTEFIEIDTGVFQLFGSISTVDQAYTFTTIRGGINKTSGFVTDQFNAPTTEPADFQQWNAIQARDVTTGGSTSTTPVEFEILNSTDTVINSTRIPKARIADEPFTMRNRVYSEDTGSNGQSNFTIATTGAGGHFGIPVLTVVSVKQNGSVLDSDNWSFDGTDTVTIDTSNVTIASGDTIAIKYDFDVFDSTLQPRAYLNRESTSETSPSISHFRYEYVI